MMFIDTGPGVHNHTQAQHVHIDINDLKVNVLLEWLCMTDKNVPESHA